MCLFPTVLFIDGAPGVRYYAAPAVVSFDLIIFDLDGTIVDSLPDIAAALNRSLAAFGRAPLSLAHVRTLVGDGVLRLAERALAVAGPSSPEDAQRLAANIQAIYLATPCVATTLYPGILGALTTLRAHGIHLAVLTNKPGAIARALLHELQVASFFESIIGDGDGYPRKPDPRAAESLIGRFSTNTQRTAMVGDGLPDMAMAHAAGCAAMAALWGYTDVAALQATHPTRLLRDPVEIADLIR